MKYCDFVIAGGGTMNREACLLGTHAITTYPYEFETDVDKYFIKRGFMTCVRNLDDFKKLNLKKLKKMKKNKFKNPTMCLKNIAKTHVS